MHRSRRYFLPLTLAVLWGTAPEAFAQAAGPMSGESVVAAGSGGSGSSGSTRSGRALPNGAPSRSGGIEPTGATLYYALGRSSTAFARPDSAHPYLTLGFQEPLAVQAEHGDWFEVRTDDGGRGYVHRSGLSNVWIRVIKSRNTILVYEGTSVVAEIPADLSDNFFMDKERQGGRLRPDHWRTPEGTFYIVRRNPNSQFYRALVLNYPSTEDARRGLENRLITRAQYRAIVRANETHQMPPMNTALGGMIEIHGQGTGARTNWTMGCVAVRNTEMDYLWDLVGVGTPVVVEP